jgi:ribose-phosphate pyrophosphokinase
VDATSINLVVPYFLGARSDRKFQEGGINYLKQVICPIINSQNFSNVTVMDPHSDVLEACINNFKKVNNFNLIDEALKEIGDKNKIILVSPDAGAYKKIFDVGKHFEINKIITATKIRDLVSGNIIDTYVPLSVYDADKNFVIIDDICDGGRTFIEIAKAIKMSRKLSSAVLPSQYGKIYLIVTHGIFSAGFNQLNEYFDGIFTTNSIQNIEHPIINQLNIF